MAFRNPARWLPATRITGLISGSQLKADAIDGKTITGATVRTSADYPRIELAPDGNLYFYPAAGMDPGRITVDGDSGSLQIIGPNGDGVDFGMTIQKAFGSTQATIDTDTVDVIGALSAGNIRAGRVAITPSAANTPTSLTVTGLDLNLSGGKSVRAQVTAATTVPGTQVTGVGHTALTSDSITIWVTRTNTTATNVEYFVIGAN